MPLLSARPQSKIIKAILMGDGGTGKTSSLVSLVKAGYLIRIMDFDNQLTPLVKLIQRDCPDKLGNVQYKSFRDKMKTIGHLPTVDGAPSAFTDALKSLDHWKDGEVDLGKPGEWGDKTVLVIDSFTRMSDAAENWADFFMVRAGKSTGQKDGREIVGEAQNGLRQFLALITDASFNTNVILICHINYTDGGTPGATKFMPKAAGKKLSPDIPTYFETYLMAENSPQGKIIRTQATPMADLKNAASFEVPATLPIQTGLADFFKIVKGEK